MTFSLDPDRNPIVRLYELFDRPGVVAKDAKRLGVEGLDLRQLGCEPARELIRFLRATLAADLGTCRLMGGRQELVNFAAVVTEWFRWQPLTDLGLLAEGSPLAKLQRDVSLLAGPEPYWPPWRPDSEEACLAVLEEIAAAPPAVPLTLEISVGKEKLVRRHLLAPLGDAATEVSAFVWRHPTAMEAAFEEGFSELLGRFAGAAERPVVLFFHRGTEPLSLDFLKVLPLGGDAPLAEREAAVVAGLGELAQTRGEYRRLRRALRSELRPDVGQQFHLPPALFLRRDLAGYPDHPLLTAGPLRSLLLYALLAWLAQQTEARDGALCLQLPGAGEAELDFTPSGVLGPGGELFAAAEDWRTELLLLTHDVHRSAGREDLREHWQRAAEQTLSPDGLRADRFFAQLGALRERFNELVRQPCLRELAPGGGGADGGEPEAVEAEGQPAAGEEPGAAAEQGRDAGTGAAAGAGPGPTAADRELLLQLRVFLNRRTDGSEFEFELDCEPLGWFLKDAGRTTPREFKYHEMSKLAAEAWRRFLSPVAALDTLESRGRRLWEELIPQPLRIAYYNEIRRHRHQLTLLIVSSDPSFPWELVRPHSVDGDFTPDYSELSLAGSYRLARWLAGSRPPVAEIGFERVCCVADGRLANAGDEAAYFRQAGVELRCPQTRDQLIKVLRREDFDVLHFSCHGVFDKQDPADSVIRLPDGKELRPDDLSLDDIAPRMRRRRPLVFLNCCHSGCTAPDHLTGLGGWATSLINLGCGAVIGCGWAVVDELAAKFSLAFYDAWRGGRDLSGAVLEARRATREQASDNPTWLAYYLFGHPYCTLRGAARQSVDRNSAAVKESPAQT